jgi:hypothetical protein
VERQLLEEAALVAQLSVLPFSFLENLYSRFGSPYSSNVFKFDATLGTTLLMCGKLLQASCQATEAIAALQQALSILRIVYASSHPYIAEAIDLL